MTKRINDYWSEKSNRIKSNFINLQLNISKHEIFDGNSFTFLQQYVTWF